MEIKQDLFVDYWCLFISTLLTYLKGAQAAALDNISKYKAN